MTNPKSKERRAEQLHAISYRWQFLPENLQTALVEIVSNYGPKTLFGRFPTPFQARWSDVEIVFTHYDRVRIVVAGVSKEYTIAELGLQDKRRPSHARGEWRMLKTYAENSQPDAYYKLPHRKNLKIEISRFRHWFQGFFGITGDPLKPFKSDLWLRKFKIGVDYA